MMFTSFCQLAWPHTCVFFLLILCNLTLSASKPSVSYSQHCGSVVSEATPTTYADFAFPYLQTSASSLTGGERILGNSPSSYVYSFDFHTSRNVHATTTQGVYKIEAVMAFRVYNDVYYPESNATYGISPRRRRRSDRLKFLLHGFWSESSGKGCFVGSASWYSSKGETLNLEAKFNINYSKNSTYSNSFVTGKLESLSQINDESYFEPISILSFPQVKHYEYKLISEEIVRGFHVDDVEKSSVLESHPGEICSLFSMAYIPFNLEYISSCNSSVKNCSPVDGVSGYVPTYISLYSIQCYEYGNKMRFLAHLTNSSYGRRYGMLNSNSTLVGEGLWDEKTNSLVIVACRILSSSHLGDTRVGDCSYRLSLWFPSVWSIKNRDKGLGQIWTNKTAKDLGYFGKINLRTSDKYLNLPGLKYGYTETEKVNDLCPKKTVRSGEKYPSAQSYDMRFDISVKYFSWGYAEPIFIGNKSYAHSPVYSSNSRWGGYGGIMESEVEFEDAVDNVPLNVSYELSFYSMSDVKLGAGYSSLNASLNSNGKLDISAEGVYDPRTGCLCLVGCRNMGFNQSLVCDIVLNFQFPGAEGSNGGFIKGSMKSTREQSDPLFFEKLSMTASSFSFAEAQRSVWRIDLEVILVLISNTLACLFICYQIYYVKKYPNTMSYMSLVMLLILTLGHMIPLVLNFEALFTSKQNTQNIMLSTSGWVEVNEVIVRVITMAAFLLQFRLLQLAWTARGSGESNKQGISVAEEKTLFVSLPIYIVGGLIAFLVNWKKNYYGNAPPAFDYSQAQYQQHTLWGDFRSYAGLILDGFLFPQVLLNIFQMSKESALSMPFYLGTTLIHIVPHVYDIYRANNYVPSHVMRSYIYANPGADYYSAAWDIIIPLGGLFLVVIIFLQQRYGGRIILPRKFRELELYAKVPVDEA